MRPLLSTRAAAGILGVHESTVKRWCNEGVIRSDKTKGGHRRISIEAIVSFAKTERINHPLLFFGDDASRVWQISQSIQKTDNFKEAIRQLLQWYKQNEVSKAYQFVRFLLGQGVVMAHLMDSLFGKLLTRVGEEWRGGQISIGYEHLVYHGVRNTLELLGNEEKKTSQASRLAIVGCIDGCRHEAGSLMVRAVLRNQGWQVLYLGADVPHEEYAYMQSRTSAHLVCISIPLPHGMPEARGLVRQLSSFYEEEKPYRVVLGGSGVYPKDAGALKGNTFQDLRVFQQLVPFSKSIK